MNWINRSRSLLCQASMASLILGILALKGVCMANESRTLKSVAPDRVLIGTAIGYRHIHEPNHARLISSQFNSLTAGNQMKPDALQNVQGKFTFERADEMVEFARTHGMTVIGHTLVWHNQAPKWLFEDAQGKPLSRKQALSNMKAHITAVVTHFKGRVKGWDVVNEAVPDAPGDLRETPAFRAIGDDYVLKAFEYAHEADPDVELYYNDYNIDMDYKRDRGLRLVKRIRDAGLRIDAVGIQGHWSLEGPSLEEIERGVQAYVDEGFKVMVTELDVDVLPRKGHETADLSATEMEGMDPYKEDLPDGIQKKLAKRYQDIFQLLLGFPEVTRITIWGTHDGNTWLNDFPVRGRTNHPMLWDRQLQPKPSFDSVFETLKTTSGK